MCLLKWFFTHFHRACGQWHEQLECPLCRAPLPKTPAYVPRPQSTCPFTPNRLADDVIHSFVRLLEKTLQSPHEQLSAPRKSKGKDKEKNAAPAPEPPILYDEDEEMAGWRRGGSLRADWDDRDG